MVKFYGSRFCAQCGRLFQLAEYDDRICASCEHPAAPARPAAATVTPVPAPVTVKPRRETRKRGPRPKNTATGRNSGPVTGPRTLPMLRALEAAPAGLTTPQLAEHASSATSWINALGSTRQLMLKQEKLGRVKRAGTAAGNRTRESAVWRITEDGQRYVNDGAQDGPPHFPGQAEPDIPPGQPRPDLRITEKRKVSFRLTDREPTGISADCFYVLGMYDDGGGLTAAELHQAIARENESMGWPVPTPVQVAGALANTLAPRGLVTRAFRGRWEQTVYGAKMLAAWTGDDEPDSEPAREHGPSGLGWPTARKQTGIALAWS